MKPINIVYCLFIFLFLSCSSSDDESESSNSDVPSSEPPNNVAFVNMSFGGVGERAPIKGCTRLPRAGEEFYRTRLDLPTQTLIGLYGVNFNEDGSFIDSSLGIGDYSSTFSGRNKMTVVFAVVDEERANADLTIRNLDMPGEGGTSISSCSLFGWFIDGGTYEVTPRPGFEEVTAGFDKITYTVVDYSSRTLSIMIVAGDLNQSNLNVVDFFDLIKQNTVTIPILMLEYSKVEDGEFNFVQFVPGEE